MDPLEHIDHPTRRDTYSLRTIVVDVYPPKRMRRRVYCRSDNHKVNALDSGLWRCPDCKLLYCTHCTGSHSSEDTPEENEACDACWAKRKGLT